MQAHGAYITFMLLICLRKQAFDTSSKHKSPSLS